jgi:hypothetical protein
MVATNGAGHRGIKPLQAVVRSNAGKIVVDISRSDLTLPVPVNRSSEQPREHSEYRNPKGVYQTM